LLKRNATGESLCADCFNGRGQNDGSDEKGIKHDLTDVDVKVTVGFEDIEIIDNEDDGVVAGEIIQIIYKGDHYQIIIRTEEEDDFVVNTEYTWNEFDRVSVKIAKEKIKLSLKTETK
jgi:spermidine/putrescine transport system ATP-binding protein